MSKIIYTTPVVKLMTIVPRYGKLMDMSPISEVEEREDEWW